MRELPGRQASDPSLRASDQGQPCIQHAAGARRDLGRRAPGLYRPCPRPRQSGVRGMDRGQRIRRLMADFLLELLCEEIPARMQARARNDLARMFAEETQKAGLATGAIDVHSTPRRLVLIARDVAGETAASR